MKKRDLTQEAILAIDDNLLAERDKKALIEKLYPKTPLSKFQSQLIQFKLKNFQSKRWKYYLKDDTQNSKLKPYRFTHDMLIIMGNSKSKSIEFKGRVTDFTGWIFSIHNHSPCVQSLEDGKNGERKVAALMSPIPNNEGWELIYKDSLDGKSEPMNITNLVINEQNLRGVPDLVFREKSTGRIIIVERKTSNKDIPADGWPNLRSQLWAYSKIDKWANAPEIILIGEVWGFDGRGDIYLRHVFRWSANDKDFNYRNNELFELYSSAVS